ncbi:MAG: alanine:cation symporter family protein [Nannocystaceae bacterium]|nr:alanine:cation symporter family protein [Nannocystaceae bacterium]
MLVPALAAGLLGTLSALVLLTGNGPEALPRVALDADPAEAQQPAFSPIVADKTMFPLERAESRGLRPSRQVGQTIVMPEDTTLEAGEHYAVLLRSSPRGHATAKFDVKRNAVILPAWQVADDVDEIIFRARENDRGALAAWDIRVPCDREVRAPQAGGKEFLKLTPKDPNLKLGELITALRLSPQVHVPIGDFHFTGRLGRATVGDLGAHVAMFEPRRAGRPFNPKLHEFFRNGFRGPYADDGSPPAPFAFVTEANYTPRIGAIVRLALQAHPRGEPMLDVTRAGNLEAPAWKFLMKATTVVVRHETDPSKDIRFEVKARAEQFRIRYDVVGGEHDFSRIPEGWHGPFIVVPDFEFEAEVRGDSRLPPALSGRRVLIPVHETSAPQGPYGDQWPYDPHPSDVLAMGMHGPTLAARGAARVAVRFSGHLGPLGTMAIVVCTIIFALTTLVAWSQISARAAAALGGPGAAKAMPAVLVAAAAVGAWVSLTSLIAVADVAMALAVATNLVGLLLALPRIVAAGRDLSGGNS